MRRDLVDSLLIGGSIGFIALASHALTNSAPPSLQLVALLVAGAVIFCLQIALTIRRARRDGRSHDESAEADQQAPALRHSRRNPFFRELTRDWTGLDEHTDATGHTWDGQGAPLEDELQMQEHSAEDRG